MKFYANRCEFGDGDSKVPVRESLMVSGSDLYCFRDEKLMNFKAEINGKIQIMSCCKKLPRTTTTEQPTTTQEAESTIPKNQHPVELKSVQNQSETGLDLSNQSLVSEKITLLESQKVLISILNDLTKTDIEDGDDAILQVDTSPVPHIKLRGNENNLPPLQIKKKSMPRVEFVLSSVFVKDSDISRDVGKTCCRYSSARYLTSSVFMFLVCFVAYVCFYSLFIFS